jgi:capsular polysaccharide biosynthesis protein
MPVKSTDDFTDSFKVAIFLFKWRKTLLILGVAAAVLSAIFSSPVFITPLYKSTVIMYPASSNSISKSLFNENGNIKQDILEFGAEEQTQQMMQILNSNKIRDKVILKFNLAGHYGIEPGSKYFQTDIYNHFGSNINYKLTEYLAVKITVLDKDPQMAADIANQIAALLDSVKNDMQKERAIQGFKIVEAEYLTQEKVVRTMEDSLTRYRKLGVNDYESQAEMMNRQLAKEIALGNTRAINALEQKIEMLSEYGGPYVSIRDALYYEKKQLSYLKSRYEVAKIDAYEAIPQKFIVENAYKADRKSYPIIWIIVLLSTLSTLLAGMVIIFMVEKSPEFIHKLKQTQR